MRTKLSSANVMGMNQLRHGRAGCLGGLPSVTLLALELTACGGATGGPAGSGGEGMPVVEPTGGRQSTGGVTATGGFNAFRATGGATGGITSDYVEEQCPDEEPPPVEQECDPFEPSVGCPSGYGCYPYLEYPYGQRCGFPQFGATCAPASSGSQGDSCGDGQGHCAPGYLCVVGTGAGARCARLCPLTTPTNCPSGLICTETDVKGYGVCF